MPLALALFRPLIDLVQHQIRVVRDGHLAHTARRLLADQHCRRKIVQHDAAHASLFKALAVARFNMRFTGLGFAFWQDPPSSRLRCHKQQRNGVATNIERYDP